MTSQEQIDANRANTQHSTGPRTPEGKAAFRLNALKHGLTAEHAVIPGEDLGVFNETLRASLDHLQPVGPLETLLVQQIVMASWRLARLRTLETGLFRLRLLGETANITEEYQSLIPEARLAYAFFHHCSGPDSARPTQRKPPTAQSPNH
jgi:hypothetical protein